MYPDSEMSSDTPIYLCSDIMFFLREWSAWCGFSPYIERRKEDLCTVGVFDIVQWKLSSMVIIWEKCNLPEDKWFHVLDVDLLNYLDPLIAVYCYFICKSTWKGKRNLSSVLKETIRDYFYRPQTKFWARLCFYKCLSFCPRVRGGWLPSMYHRSHDQPGGVCLQGVCIQRGLPPGACVGVCMQRGIGQTPWIQTPHGCRPSTPWMHTRKVDGTHPTGMLSCRTNDRWT